MIELKDFLLLEPWKPSIFGIDHSLAESRNLVVIGG
jgi:hypothetical protein